MTSFLCLYQESQSLKRTGVFIIKKICLEKSKTVLFLGYGLEEIEVLEYILRRGSAADKDTSPHIRRFILQGFFNSEIALLEMLRNYYLETFNVDLIGFPKDYKYYEQQEQILDSWSDKLIF